MNALWYPNFSPSSCPKSDPVRPCSPLARATPCPSNHGRRDPTTAGLAMGTGSPVGNDHGRYTGRWLLCARSPCRGRLLAGFCVLYEISLERFCEWSDVIWWDATFSANQTAVTLPTLE